MNMIKQICCIGDIGFSNTKCAACVIFEYAIELSAVLHCIVYAFEKKLTNDLIIIRKILLKIQA